MSAASIALFLSAPAAFADAQPNGATPVATAGQVTPTTSDTTSTTTSTLDTGTPVSSQSTISPSNVSLVGPDTSPNDASGSASADPDPGGSGTLHVIVSTASDPGATGSSATSTGPPGDTSSTATDTPPDTSPNPPSSNVQDAESDAASQQTGASNGNVSVRVDQGGNTGTVTQGNNAGSSASSSATGDLPQSASDPSAVATANTTQDSPSNTNVTVRVGSPGDIAPVGQQNDAQAGASATGSNAATGNGGGGQATANASQTSPGNINVVVRVDSAGNNGAVNQQNTVGAAAGPNAGSTPVGGVATSGGAQTDQLSSATNTQTAVTNNGVVDQQLIQTQDNLGPDVNTVGDFASDPAAGSAKGTATATQTGAQNINVSVRIGSPGTDGTVTQTNGATASATSPDLSIVNVSGGKNTNVSIVLPGSANGAPGNLWSWNWNWTGNGTPVTGANATGAAPTDGSAWNWAWTPTSSSAPPAATTSTPGMFTWIWVWTTADGKTWTLTQQQACSCNWTWTWNWDWSLGAPTSTAPTSSALAPDSAPSDSAPTATYDDGPVDQSNTVDATATASVDVTLDGLLSVNQEGVDPSLQMQDAEFGQSFANSQTAIAVAGADQLNPWNVNSVWGVPVASVKQANFVSADSLATASASLDQELIQGQDGADGAYQWVGAQQTTSNIQAIAAGTQASQNDAGNANLVSAPHPNQAAVSSVEQTNSATTSAAATAVATLVQQVAQFEDATSAGVELIDITQQIDSNQFAMVASVVQQLRTRNVDNLVVPAGSRATNPTVRQRNIVDTTTKIEDTGDLTQVAFQYQGGAVAIELTSAIQQIDFSQAGLGYAPAGQADTTNYAGWLGVEPPLPPSDGGDDGQPGTTSGTTSNSGPVAGLSPATNGLSRVNAPFHPQTSEPVLHTTGTTKKHHATSGGSGPALFLPPRVVGTQPGTTTPAVSTSPSVATQFQQSSSPNALEAEPAGAPHATGGSAPVQHPAPLLPGFPNDPFSAAAGTSASAPSSGSGQTVLASGPYKFAAQLETGPQLPTSVLGRPMISSDPFERPG